MSYYATHPPRWCLTRWEYEQWCDDAGAVHILAMAQGFLRSMRREMSGETPLPDFTLRPSGCSSRIEAMARAPNELLKDIQWKPGDE